MGEDKPYFPLFETKRAKGSFLYKFFSATIFASICLVWWYRMTQIPGEDEDGRWVWIGMFAAEVWFGFYWILSLSLRWNPLYRCTFKNRLLERFKDDFPAVDVFVCTADPAIEPPIMVVNTVLSVMAYDYPPEKLAVYLSDDAGSNFTFYAILEASEFARYWIPYCKKFNVEPRSPAAHFVSEAIASENEQFTSIKKLYAEMEDRIETATKLGRIPEEAILKPRGFSQWDSYSSKRDHSAVLQILIDGRDSNSVDIDGFQLPSLVYLAREKRPEHFHNFKAGAINALIRVSSKISNAPVILTQDCDMYSNNSVSIRDALCFFMDEKQSHDIGFVQFPQCFENITKNDLYGSSLKLISEVEFHGLDGYGGPFYIGSNCFHRRDILCGRKYSKSNRIDWKSSIERETNLQELQEEAKALASCAYEQNTQWGREMGLKYGCPVEDVITGLSIKCNGWKSVYYRPEREAFLGVAPTSLPQVLVQQKRWSEGDLQIMLSKYSPAWYAHRKISFGLQLCYMCFCLWAPNCFAFLCYTIIPPLCLLKGISLFPEASSPWMVPFVYAVIASNIYCLAEFLWLGGTILGWWNEQRIWLYKRLSSYFFACIDTFLKTLGFAEASFVITAKVAEEDVLRRCEKEIMEFGASSPMLTVLATIAMLNLLCFVGVVVKKMVMSEGSVVRLIETMALQILLCGVLILVNWPLYEGLFLRKDNGKLPSSLAITSFALALASTTLPFYY